MANNGKMQSNAHNDIASGKTDGRELEFDVREINEERERLHRLEMINYTVKVPAVKGAGSAVAEIDELAKRMKKIYDQTQELIIKTEEMLKHIGITIQMTDEYIASSYAVNGSCYKPGACYESK